MAIVLAVLTIGGPADAATVGLDASFDGDGAAITVFPQSSQAASVAVQSDGKIVAGGQSYDAGFNGSFTLIRYNEDGTLDPSFDGDGIVTTTIGANSSWINSIAIQSDGKIVAGGVSYIASYHDFTVARYNADGSLDTSFDGDGIVTTSFGSEYDTLEAVVIDADGKIVAGGTTDTSNIRDFALARFNSDGTLDTTFDTDGKVTTAAGTFMNSIAIQSDGKIVGGGSNNSGSDFMLARYNTDGSLDGAFGIGGLVTTDVGGFEQIASVAVAPTGEIVVGGSSSGSFVVARYDSSGLLDTSFDTDGMVSTSIRGLSDTLSAVTIQPDGMILAAGNSYVETDPGNFFAPWDSDFALARYNPNGTLDTTFDSDGKVTTDFGGNTDLVNSVAILGDGKVLVAGASSGGPGFNFTVARYASTDATPPSASIDTTPDNPDNDTTPTFTFSSDDGAATFMCRIHLQADAAPAYGACSGAGTHTSTALADGAYRFEVEATDAAGNSASESHDWTLDATAPNAPTFTTTDPVSPADGNDLLITGVAEAASTVSLYTNAACTGAPEVSGDAVTFAGPGLAVVVGDDTITTFWATATDAVGNSSVCSIAGITYIEDTPNPPNPQPTPTPTPTPDPTPEPEIPACESDPSSLCVPDGDHDFDAESSVVHVTAGSGDIIITGSGNTIVVEPGFTGTITIIGTGNTVTGSSGDDQLNVDGCDNTVDGGEGNDVIVVNCSDAAVSSGVGLMLETFSGRIVVAGGPGRDVIHNLGRGAVLRGKRGHDEIYGGYGNDIISGGMGRDLLWGRAGNDKIRGGRAADIIYGGPGNDEMWGGPGIDRLYGGSGTDVAHPDDDSA